jgi:hypothetical protein
VFDGEQLETGIHGVGMPNDIIATLFQLEWHNAVGKPSSYWTRIEDAKARFVSDEAKTVAARLGVASVLCAYSLQYLLFVADFAYRLLTSPLYAPLIQRYSSQDEMASYVRTMTDLRTLNVHPFFGRLYEPFNAVSADSRYGANTRQFLDTYHLGLLYSTAVRTGQAPPDGLPEAPTLPDRAVSVGRWAPIRAFRGNLDMATGLHRFFFGVESASTEGQGWDAKKGNEALGTLFGHKPLSSLGSGTVQVDLLNPKIVEVMGYHLSERLASPTDQRFSHVLDAQAFVYPDYDAVAVGEADDYHVRCYVIETSQDGVTLAHHEYGFDPLEWTLAARAGGNEPTSGARDPMNLGDPRTGVADLFGIARKAGYEDPEDLLLAISRQPATWRHLLRLIWDDVPKGEAPRVKAVSLIFDGNVYSNNRPGYLARAFRFDGSRYMQMNAIVKADDWIPRATSLLRDGVLSASEPTLTRAHVVPIVPPVKGSFEELARGAFKGV